MGVQITIRDVPEQVRDEVGKKVARAILDRRTGAAMLPTASATYRQTLSGALGLD